MLGRDNVSAILNEIIAKLNSRLKKHPHKILSQAQFNSSEYRYCLQCDDKNYIVFMKESKFHNTDLTLHRIRNVYNIHQLLNAQMTELLKDTPEQLCDRVNKIHELLEKGIAINKQISNNFGVSHVSFKENRLAGHSVASSLWNTAPTDSRSQGTFTKAIKILDQFKIKFGLSIPNISEPPAYSAPVMTVK